VRLVSYKNEVDIMYEVKTRVWEATNPVKPDEAEYPVSWMITVVEVEAVDVTKTSTNKP